MEFFEKIGKKASETYKSAAEKTSKVASETMRNNYQKLKN